MIILTDWDGTVCITPPGTNYEDVDELLARCTPRLRVIERLAAAAAAGHQVGIVTARGQHVATATRQQAAAWLPDVELVGMRHRPRLVYDQVHYVPDKERAIRDLRGALYIGDRTEDRAAALRAGARFAWDWEWERHGAGLLPAPLMRVYP